MAGYGRLSMQTLELLATGFLIGFTKGREGRKKLWQQYDEVWMSVDRKALHQVLERFKVNGFVKFILEDGNREKVILTPLGKSAHLRYKFRNVELQKAKKWDKVWRMVLFDIPESKRKIRDALRRKLKDLGFLEFQKSVFLFPFPCEEEVNFIINFFDISEHVYYIESGITPDNSFRAHFKL